MLSVFPCQDGGLLNFSACSGTALRKSTPDWLSSTTAFVMNHQLSLTEWWAHTVIIFTLESGGNFREHWWSKLVISRQDTQLAVRKNSENPTVQEGKKRILENMCLGLTILWDSPEGPAMTLTVLIWGKVWWPVPTPEELAKSAASSQLVFMIRKTTWGKGSEGKPDKQIVHSEGEDHTQSFQNLWCASL